ncbi:hypothetical protein [Pseudoroseomonas cervicalis]|uniref:hypothetical protein n=1 Tax=Teichococcus cervicalis TaxID=204525 RepID=UPI0022F1B223|nr:hypothetical protein [Pseudoroseomonas cervicalis]WBV43977.1 hypothetical protein PFY06_05250 [Pseudoroseomonas cervicalis]
MSWTRAVLCAALVYFGLVGGGMMALHLFFAGAMLWRGEKGVLPLLLPVLGVAALSGYGLYLAWQAFAQRSASAFLPGLPLWVVFNVAALLLAALHDRPMFWVEEETTPVTGTVLLVLGAGWLLALLGGVVLWRLPQAEPGKAEPSRD